MRDLRPAQLTRGMRVRLHDQQSVFVVLRHVESPYSDSTYQLENIDSGWVLTAHGINLYPDGTIDWDFSTGGHFRALAEILENENLYKSERE